MYRSRKTKNKYNPEQAIKRHALGVSHCPFCNKHIEVVKQAKYFLVVVNGFAYDYWELMNVEDHLMIIPVRHILSIAELTDKERIEWVSLVAYYESRGYNIYLREKDNITKSVPHQHTHLIKTKNKHAKFFVYLRRPYFTFKA